MDHRAAAWNALHRPETTGAQLHEIAQRYPEFAATIAAHPNAYDDLKAWAATQPVAAPAQAAHQEPAPQEPAASDPTPARGRRTGTIIAIAATVALLGGAGVWGATTNWWGLTSATPGATGPSPSASSTATTEPAGDALPPAQPLTEVAFVGTELDQLMPTDEQLRTTYPKISEISRLDNYFTYGETEGFVGDPRVCGPFVFHDFSLMSGFRAAHALVPGQGGAHFSVTQVPTIEQGQEIWDRFEAASTSCSAFTGRPGDTSPAYSFTVLDTRDENYTTAFLGTSLVTAGANEYNTDLYFIAARHGNAVMNVSLPMSLFDEATARATLDLVMQLFADARSAAAEELGRPLG